MIWYFKLRILKIIYKYTNIVIIYIYIYIYIYINIYINRNNGLYYGKSNVINANTIYDTTKMRAIYNFNIQDKKVIHLLF